MVQNETKMSFASSTKEEEKKFQMSHSALVKKIQKEETMAMLTLNDEADGGVRNELFSGVMSIDVRIA